MFGADREAVFGAQSSEGEARLGGSREKDAQVRSESVSIKGLRLGSRVSMSSGGGSQKKRKAAVRKRVG